MHDALLAADVEEETRLRSRGADLARELERVVARPRRARQPAHRDGRRAPRHGRRARRPGGVRQGVRDVHRAAATTSPSTAAPAIAPDTTASGFAAARGRLLFPVVGRAEVRPAHREGTDGPGLEIHAPVGTVVRAVFAGRVAFADRYGPYGRIVILDHGDHYYSVSGDLDEIDVKIGQELGAGERIGTVGDDGQGAMLYFEVRHGSQTVAPGPWLGL